MQQDEFLRFNGKIYVVSKHSENFKEVINLLKVSSIVGFDTESKPSFRKGLTNKPSLIQFATKEFAVLYRIQKQSIANEIISILEDENIIKVGTGITQDLNQLSKISVFKPASFVDIQKLAQKLSINNISLKKLTEQLLNKKLSKRQQLSNWEAINLSDAQIKYAATDAYACLLIYEKLINELSKNNNKE
jgi:ribonuclease D